MRIYLSFIFLFLSAWSFGQGKLLPYKIEGHINADTGIIKMYYSVDSSLQPKSFKLQKARVVNKRFNFEGVMPYPQSIMLIYAGYRTDDFVIEPGTQIVTCNVDSTRKTPLVENEAMREYETVFKPAHSDLAMANRALNAKWKSLQQTYGNKIPDTAKLAYMHLLKQSYVKSDERLLQYIKGHPQSYLAFWRLVRLSGFGYEDIFDEMYANLSPTLKNTFTGKVLRQKLAAAGGLTAIGKPFPNIKAATAQNQPLQTGIYLKNKFTLIDFWYSNCAPCIAQFDDLTTVYQDYHNKGLEIIGLSTDRIKDEGNWKRIIKTRKLPWLQYWDKNGMEARRLAITAFPTNFLLDSNGAIIKKNLSPSELREFLASQTH